MKDQKKIGVVIVLTALVVGLLGYQIGGPAAAGRLLETRTRLSAYAGSCAAFYRAVHRWPTNLSELRTNTRGEAFIDPREPEVDGWGHPIELVPPSTSEARMVLRSLGADRRIGGVGLDADIEFSWTVSIAH